MRPVALRPQLALGLPLSRGRVVVSTESDGAMEDPLSNILAPLGQGEQYLGALGPGSIHRGLARLP
jgi:hypothetical protein